MQAGFRRDELLHLGGTSVPLTAIGVMALAGRFQASRCSGSRLCACCCTGGGGACGATPAGAVAARAGDSVPGFPDDVGDFGFQSGCSNGTAVSAFAGCFHFLLPDAVGVAKRGHRANRI